MKLRQCIEQHGWIVVTALVVIVVLAIWRPWSVRADVPRGQWYYNVTTGELVVVDMKKGQLSVNLSDGQTGVMAAVFGCGGCEPDQRFIGYLTKHTGQAASGAAAVERPTEPAIGRDGLVVAAEPAAGEPLHWVPFNSHQGASIMSSKDRRCADGGLTTCFPE